MIRSLCSGIRLGDNKVGKHRTEVSPNAYISIGADFSFK